MAINYGFILVVFILGAIGLFFAWKTGLFNKVRFKGREEVEQIIFLDSAEKMKVLGLTPKRKTILYRDVMPIGSIWRMVNVPYNVITKVKYEDEKTGEEKWRKDIINGNMFMFEIREGLFAFLGFGKTLFLVNEKYVQHLSDGYKIMGSIDLERWGTKFWYSKDEITKEQVEGISWKSSYTDVLGLVKEFPSKVINYDVGTSKSARVIEEDYKGQKELKQGRIVQ